MSLDIFFSFSTIYNKSYDNNIKKTFFIGKFKKKNSLLINLLE
jgi:hypothetical protein